MSSIAIRVLIQVAVAAAALLGLEYSLLNVLTGSAAGPDDPVRVDAFGIVLTGPKRQVEMQIRIALLALAFAGLFLYEAIAFWRPRQNLRQFRKEYLDTERNAWRHQLPEDVRVNLMFARRRWYCLWLCKVFEWTWNDGFRPEHRDANMWMASWQGVCGKAYRTRARSAQRLFP